jgi:hypothetical protein
MGTYALSAGYYDAYYKRAQQVRLAELYHASCALYLSSKVADSLGLLQLLGHLSSTRMRMYVLLVACICAGAHACAA